MKKIISLTLALCMIVSMLSVAPISVSATGTASDLINVAMNEVGNSDGTKYGTSGAWCAAFVSWCARQAGIPTNVIKSTINSRASDFGVPYYTWEDYYSGRYTPSRGDLVFFNWSSNEQLSLADHVGIIRLNPTKSGNYVTITTVEGNMGTPVGFVRSDIVRKVELATGSITTFDSGYIIGFGKPNYTGSSTSKPTAPIPDGELKSTASTYLTGTHKNITFSYAGLTYAEEVKINFKKDGVVYLTFDATKSRDYTTYFENPGHYSVYFTAKYGNEWIKLDDMVIDIVEPVFYADKTIVDTFEEITFTYDGLRYADKVYINFEKEGNAYFTSDMTSSKNHKNYFENEGIYIAYVTAKYPGGTIVSEGVKITVGKYKISYDTKCEDSILSTEKIFSNNAYITETIPTREHYKFLGWTTYENSTIVKYNPGDAYSNNEDITLYAVWEPILHIEGLAEVVLSDVSGKSGDTVKVKISLKSKEEINSIAISEISYDKEMLTFEGFSDYKKIESLTVLPPTFDAEKMAIAIELKDATAFDGDICTLNFKIKDGVDEGSANIIATSLVKNSSTIIASYVEPGIVTVRMQLLGDINGDGEVTTKDVTTLRRYIAGGYDVTVIDKVLDVNRDNTITTKDVTTLRRFIAGGYGVELN